MEDIDARGVLAAIPLFADTLSARQLDHLAAQCQPVFFPAGTFLISEGDFGDSMFAIVDGDASVTLHDERGGEPAPAQHVRAGEQPGEQAADHERERDGASGDGERVAQRLPEEVARHRREHRPLEIVQRPAADLGPGPPRVAELDLDRVVQQRDDRHDDQIAEEQRQQHTDGGRRLAPTHGEAIAPIGRAQGAGSRESGRREVAAGHGVVPLTTR